MKTRIVLLAALVALAGCGGASRSVNSTIPAAQLTTDARAETVDAAAIDAAASDVTERPMAGTRDGWEAGLPQPQRGTAGAASGLHPQSYYGNANAGQGGVSILSASAPSPRVNLVAHHSLYHGAEWSGGTQINLLKPGPSQIGDVLLYAPTMKAPNGDCIEAGTAYYNGGSSTNYTTHAYIYAFDFCGGTGKTLHPDTVPGWFDTYVRVYKDGVPKYIVQICNCKGKQSWSIRYFNHTTNQFDTFYTTSGYYSGFGLGGWTQFETQYNVAQGSNAPCSPSLPTIEDSDVHFVSDGGPQFLNDQNGRLYPASAGETSFGSYGKCFNANTTPASYVFSLPSGAYDSWRVVSTGS